MAETAYLRHTAEEIDRAADDTHTHENKDVLDQIISPPAPGPPGADGKLMIAFRVDERGHLLLSSSDAVGERFRVNPATGHLEYITDWSQSL